MIRENFSYRMYLDDLPSATTLDGSEMIYSKGVPLGYIISKDNI